MNTHRRTTQAHQTVPRCRHSTTSDPRKSLIAIAVNQVKQTSTIRSPADLIPLHLPVGSHPKTVSVRGDSEASAHRIQPFGDPRNVKTGNFSLIGLLGPSASQPRAMGTLRVPPVMLLSQIRAPSLRRKSKYRMAAKSGTVQALRCWMMAIGTEIQMESRDHPLWWVA